jgi:hypothetical protein
MRILWSKRYIFLFFILFSIYLMCFKIIDIKLTNNNSRLKYIKPMNNLDQIKKYQTTVVSSYFKLNKSKHSNLNYKNWIQNFFLSVSAPLILFTDENSIDQDLLNLRKHLPTRLYIYSSHWEILNEIELKRQKNYTSNYKNEQNKIDPEKQIHNADLYVLWNIKSYITNKIAQENPFNSDVFMYTDSGAWRDKPLLNWPNESFIKNVTNIIKDNVLFGQITNSKLEVSQNFPWVNIIEGGFFMGNSIAISNFEKNFWNLHDERLSKKLFIGKDQIIMNIITFNLSKSIYRLQTWDLECEFKVDKWFFYQYYFANDEYYLCKKNRELLLLF